MGAREELEAIQTAFDALEKLTPEERIRALAWLQSSLEVPVQPQPPPLRGDGQVNDGPRIGGEPGSTQHLQAFLADRQPTKAIDRVAALGYYLTHHRGRSEFRPKDLEELNQEAGWANLQNWSRDVANAAAAGYIVDGSNGRRLGARGEALVQAMPDPEAVKAALKSGPPKPRRKAKKAAARRAPAKAARK